MKPLFSAVPMTHRQHVQQHIHGETVHRPVEWFEERAVEYLEQWMQTLEDEKAAVVTAFLEDGGVPDTGSYRQ